MLQIQLTVLLLVSLKGVAPMGSASNGSAIKKAMSVPMPSDSSNDATIGVKNTFFPTFRQPGLKKGSACTNGNFEKGFCVPLTNCTALIPIAFNPESPDYPFLQHSICGVFEGMQYVCCKTATTTARPLSKTTTPPRNRVTPSTVRATIRKKTQEVSSTSRPRTSGPTRKITTSQPRTTKTKVDCELSDELNPPGCGIVRLLGSRIAGGEIARKRSHPWIALILKKKIPACGATLVTSQYALSAAHCFVDLDSGKRVPHDAFTLRLAEHDSSTVKDGKHFDIPVAQVKVHENYRPRDFANDIAVVKMNRKVCFSSQVVPACVPDISWNWKNLVSSKAVVAGWGASTTTGSVSSVLQEAELTVFRTEVCRANYSLVYKKQAGSIDESTICAGDLNGKKDSCRGDSGGPLVFSEGGKVYLIGTVSRGPRDCSTAGFPGIYTRISTYFKWIERNIL